MSAAHVPDAPRPAALRGATVANLISVIDCLVRSSNAGIPVPFPVVSLARELRAELAAVVPAVSVEQAQAWDYDAALEGVRHG